MPPKSLFKAPRFFTLVCFVCAQHDVDLLVLFFLNLKQWRSRKLVGADGARFTCSPISRYNGWNASLWDQHIVYNGKPLNDLCLTDFLDKFMEKKPKQSTWHGGSQIEPAKKLDMSNHIIGPEILSLAESDVPPEDLVFHEFYVSKMSSTKKKKKKKKKKLPEEEAAEELFDEDGGGDESDVDVECGDESDNEQIENMLDAAIELEDGEYDYDYLDKVANDDDDDDDDDLLGNASDVEMDMDMLDGEEEHAASPNEDFVDDDNDGTWMMLAVVTRENMDKRNGRRPLNLHLQVLKSMSIC